MLHITYIGRGRAGEIERWGGNGNESDGGGESGGRCLEGVGLLTCRQRKLI